jgi:histidyl-tRNA synthetase
VRALGIREILSINFLGNDETRNNYKEKLKKYILEKEILLCKDCERKYIKNALRILDCSKCSKNNFPPYNSS